MPRIPKKTGTHVTALINDGGTCLAPAVVLQHSPDGKYAELLISISSGFKGARFRTDSEYVGRPSPDMAERAALTYALLAERAAFMMSLIELPTDIAQAALAAYDSLPVCEIHGLTACGEKCTY